MQNIARYNKLYLSGGGNEHQSFLLDKFFFENLPKNGKFLYIPIALRGNKLFSTAPKWMDNNLKLHNRTDLNFITGNKLDNYNINNLLDFDAIYIGGGNTWNLMSEINNFGFSELLIDYLNHNKKIYGGSAGAIIFGKRIDTHNDTNSIQYSKIDGLNLINGYSVACHYKETQYNRFKEWSLKNKMPIICLQEETGLIVDNNNFYCVGTKPCTIFFFDGTTKIYQPEYKFKLLKKSMS